MVSLERELYRAQRDPEVVVCVIVSKPDLSCPVDSPFSVRVETTDGNAGTLTLFITIIEALSMQLWFLTFFNYSK